MQNTKTAMLDLERLADLMIRYQWRWLLPAVLLTVTATLFAVLKPIEWDASQGLTIRNEAANNVQGPGKFGHSDERRTAQETVLELSQSHAVLSAALAQVGPPAGRKVNVGTWPNDDEVDDFRDQVKLTPPKGAELGRSEVFHLTVRDRDRGRALALVAAVREELAASYQRLRDATATSMLKELEQAVEIAKANLDAATERIAEMETAVGEDLGDLRLLHESISGESTLQRQATEIREEIRAIRAASLSNEELLKLLQAAREDPTRLVATPNRLIESHPGLHRLKNGLIDSQLRTASLLGSMSEIHPLAVAARESEEEVRRQIRQELEEAISSLELESRLNGEQIAGLQAQLRDLDSRLGRLAGLRAKYSIQIEEVENRAALLKRAEEELSQAKVAQAGAGAASLLVPIDAPVAGVDPVGPSRALIVVVGLVAGLLTGVGVVFLTVPSVEGQSDTEATCAVETSGGKTPPLPAAEAQVAECPISTEPSTPPRLVQADSSRPKHGRRATDGAADQAAPPAPPAPGLKDVIPATDYVELSTGRVTLTEALVRISGDPNAGQTV